MERAALCRVQAAQQRGPTILQYRNQDTANFRVTLM
jgi:hypothetical protein